MARHTSESSVSHLTRTLFGFDIRHGRRRDTATRNFFRSLLHVSERRIRAACAGTLPGPLVVAGPTTARARHMLRIIGLRRVISAGAFRGNRAGESAQAPVGLFQVNIVIGILLAHGSNFCVARLIAGAEARRYIRSVHTAADPIIYGILPLLIVLSASASSPSSLRIPFHAVRILRKRDGAAIHRRIYLGAGSARSGTGTNERASSHVRAKILAPQYVMPRTMFAVLDD